jgi:hypothetical protein
MAESSVRGVSGVGWVVGAAERAASRRGAAGVETSNAFC